MDTNQQPTFDEDLSTIVAQLPAPVRAFFASGNVETVAKSLMQKNQLHIDQGAIMEREIILLLLGLKSPDEFTKSLVEEAKLDQQTVNNITQDVNAQIFVPLREEMRKSPAPVSRPMNAQTPNYAPPRQASNFNLQNKIPPRPAVAFGAGGSPRSDLRNVLASVTGEKLLEDHEEPHIEFRKPAPPNLPGAMPPSRPIAPRIATPPAPMRPPYSSDPYREPLE